MQRTVGSAKLHILNVPLPSFMRSFGWQRKFLAPWLDRGLEVTRMFQPDIIRTYGNFANGFLAAHIKNKLRIPLVVSLHINPDEDMRSLSGWGQNWKDRLIMERTKYFERETLRTADLVLPVYEPIRPYAEAYGARNIRVCYNVINPSHLKVKKSYGLSSPMKIISVGRQFAAKNPAPIIQAVAQLPASLTLIGNGPYHKKLKKLVAATGHPEKFELIESLPNDLLCARLADFDVFAVHSEYFELSKSVLEAMLTGLPIVINRRRGKKVPELNGDWVQHVESSARGFYGAFERLLYDASERERLGRRAFEHSQARYSPKVTETVYVDVYDKLLSKVSQ